LGQGLTNIQRKFPTKKSLSFLAILIIFIVFLLILGYRAQTTNYLYSELQKLPNQPNSAKLLTTKEFETKYGSPTAIYQEGDTGWIYFPNADSTISFSKKNYIILNVNRGKPDFLIGLPGFQ
jgi:hypothetical protein